MQLTGSQILIECLKEQGVDTVFGYPGGAILNVYDELYKHICRLVRQQAENQGEPLNRPLKMAITLFRF